MIRGSAKKGIIVFCLTAIAFSIRAEIMPTIYWNDGVGESGI